MFNWLRLKLGLHRMEVKMEAYRDDMALRQIDLMREQEAIRKQLAALGPGLGRILAKLDPMYGKPELDNPERKAESDRLGEETIARLRAEAAAREPYNTMHRDAKDGQV